MKIHTTVLLLATLLVLGGCKSKKEAESQQSADKTGVETPKERQIDRWVVTFHSEGSGPDGSAVNVLEQKMEEWQKTYGWSLKPQIVPWGKEGEVDYCFPIRQFENFAPQRIEALFKETFGSNRKVHYSVYPDCPHKPRSEERY